MTEYIEYIFLENLIISYITIYQVYLFTKMKAKKINIIIGSIILGFYETLSGYFSFNFFENLLIKLFAICFILYIIFQPNTLKIYLKVFVYYILISFVLVGIIISLTLLFNLNISNKVIKVILYIISGLILYLFNKLMWKMWKSKIKKDNLIYEIKVGEVIIPAFVDTGNNVKDLVGNNDVLFVESKYYEKLYNNKLLLKTTYIDINTVTGKENVKGYLLNNIVIKKNKQKLCQLKNVLFIFVDRKLNNNDDYEALISYDTYLEKMKGVELC
mgnify:FL=1